MKRLIALLLCLVFLAGCSKSGNELLIDTAKLETYVSQVFNPVVNKYFQDNTEILLSLHANNARKYITDAQANIESEKTRVFELNAFEYTATYLTGVVSNKDETYRVTALLEVTMTSDESMPPYNVVVDLTWDNSTNSITELEVMVYA